MAFDCIARTASGRKRGGYRRGVSSRSRVFSFVTFAAVVASGVVVVGVLATRGHVPGAAKPRSGHPPLSLALGDRADREARDLDRAQRLYAAKDYTQAATIFNRYHSLEAQVGTALAAWPSGTIARLEELQAANRRSALVALHLGLAYYWDRRNDDALVQWRAAASRQPDTPYAVRAEDFLHPQYAPGLPRFVPSFQPPLRIRVLPGPQQVAALRADAARGGAHAKILYGTALQQLGKPVSAEGSSPRPRGSRPTTPTLASPRRSAASTRRIPRARSASSARSRASSRRPRPCASTWACCCSGRPR